MGSYSIKELEKLSGIKAHTLRIWEKRHGIIEPLRTSTNIRYYTDNDLKKIINVSLLNNHGFKISRIASMSYDELTEKVVELSNTSEELAIQIDQFIIAMIEMDEDKFEKLLSTLILRFGFEKTLVEILYPFLQKIGILWLTGNINPAQEHFVSNLIRQKIIVAIDGLDLAPKTAKRAILYLPPNELHEIGLLFYHYITKKAGYRTFYLGQNVPHEDLSIVASIHNPDVMITAITSKLQNQTVNQYLINIEQEFPKVQFLVSGYQVSKLAVLPPKNVKIFSNSSELMRYL
jgi:MerR family transcriptional regulator, light-induced transcriptional regulator